MFDIGGGLLEIVWLDLCNWCGVWGYVLICFIWFWIFLFVGVVNLVECYGGVYVILDIFEKMVDDVVEYLLVFSLVDNLIEVIGLGWVYMFGIFGMVIMLVGVYFGFKCYDWRCVDGIWFEDD